MCQCDKIQSAHEETNYKHFVRSISRKRIASSKAESSLLKESLAAPLSPVPELASGVNTSSVEATPLQKKKRKLYKQTPQLSEVFMALEFPKLRTNLW